MSNPVPTPPPAATPTPPAPTTPATPTPAAKADDEQLGAPGVDALKAERKARKAAEDSATALAAKLQAIEDKDKTEAERQQAALEQAQAELAQTLEAKTRAEVAATKSVPMDLLAGPASGSEEDVTAFADALLAFRGEQKQTPSSSAIGRANGADTQVASEADVFAQHINEQLGR